MWQRKSHSLTMIFPYLCFDIWSQSRSLRRAKARLIGDNVFIGANTTVLYGVHIGNNVIIGAGSVVSKDLPDGVVAAGIPCKPIGKFEDFKEKMKV